MQKGQGVDEGWKHDWWLKKYLLASEIVYYSIFKNVYKMYQNV